jgi:membrane protein DedA with SNARE-associated domain
MLREWGSFVLASFAGHGTFALAVGIFLGTFLSEDAATLTTSAMVQLGKIRPALGLVSCFSGIWIGDLGIFTAARVATFSPPLARWLDRKIMAAEKMQAWVAKRGWVAVLLSRFIPGTRVATSIAAGAFRMPAGLFAVVTGVAALVWVGAAIILWPQVADQLPASFQHRAIPLLAAGYLVLWSLAKLGRSDRFRFFRRSLRKYRRWEFWPAWLFYIPVVAYILHLALRYRSLHAPLFANPGIKTGGLVGESKMEILTGLMQPNPEDVADGYLVERGDLQRRLEQAKGILAENQITYPFVLKPDVGERGSGFRLLKDEQQMRGYLALVEGPVILQRYVPGPFEVGVFYYRRPSEKEGHIFAITDKVFPMVNGDGRSTLEQLIRSDDRAGLIADIYLERFENEKKNIVPAGKRIRLVEAGSHAQGCIFRDGSHLYSEELRKRIDKISRDVPGFCIGRYDLRYSDPDELRAGRNFKIIELNGVASEATSIYDERNSLLAAYRTLFKQWRLIFDIGVGNQRRLAGRRESWIEVVRQWAIARREAVLRPVAD